MNSFLLFDVCVRHEGNKLKGSLVIFMTLNPDKRPHSSIWQLHIRPDFLSEKQPSRQNLLVYQKKVALCTTSGVYRTDVAGVSAS